MTYEVILVSLLLALNRSQIFPYKDRILGPCPYTGRFMICSKSTIKIPEQHHKSLNVFENSSSFDHEFGHWQLG